MLTWVNGSTHSLWNGSVVSVSSRQISQSHTEKDCMVVSITPPAWLILFMWYAFANRCVDKVRRRVQNETLEHRGRKGDPLYRIRKLMLKGVERLDQKGTDRVLLGLRAGDPEGDVMGAWLAKESVRDVYLTDNPDDARLLLDKAIIGCRHDWVPEIKSLGRTLNRWQTEILNHHRTGASNGPTEGLNLSIKKIKRCGHGFRNFDNYRLRVLLHTGGINWPATRPPPPRIRTRTPHSDG